MRAAWQDKLAFRKIQMFDKKFPFYSDEHKSVGQIQYALLTVYNRDIAFFLAWIVPAFNRTKNERRDFFIRQPNQKKQPADFSIENVAIWFQMLL